MSKTLGEAMARAKANRIEDRACRSCGTNRPGRIKWGDRLEDGTCARCGGPFDGVSNQPEPEPSARERLEAFMAEGSGSPFAWCPACGADALVRGPEVDTCKECESTMTLVDGRWYPKVSEKRKALYRKHGFDPPGGGE